MSGVETLISNSPNDTKSRSSSYLGAAESRSDAQIGYYRGLGHHGFRRNTGDLACSGSKKITAIFCQLLKRAGAIYMMLN